MKWERIERNWSEYKLNARRRWRRITRDMAQMQVESWQGQQREPESGSA